jgi:hypothetical protein
MMEREKCGMCKGEGGFEFTLPDGELRKTPCRCNGSGLEIDNLRAKLRMNDIQISQVHKELKNVQKWIKENSTCKTCGGNQGKTWGSVPCEECGLIGNMPWPG